MRSPWTTTGPAMTEFDWKDIRSTGVDPGEFAEWQASVEFEDWLDSIGAEENIPGQDECPGCDNGPCVWATNIYPEQETA